MYREPFGPLALSEIEGMMKAISYIDVLVTIWLVMLGRAMGRRTRWQEC